MATRNPTRPRYRLRWGHRIDPEMYLWLGLLLCLIALAVVLAVNLYPLLRGEL